MNRWSVPLALLATLAAVESHGQPGATPPPTRRTPLPIVLVVGCAGRTDDPLIWNLTSAGTRRETPQAGITGGERTQLASDPLGSDAYHLVGVAEFVDVASSARAGVRAEILSPARANATGMLADGRRVGVKGLFIDGHPANINLTSVVDLGSDCP